MTMMTLFQLEHSMYFLSLSNCSCVQKLNYIRLCKASKGVEIFKFGTIQYHESVYDDLFHS